jgi:hypothetical protein
MSSKESLAECGALQSLKYFGKINVRGSLLLPVGCAAVLSILIGSAKCVAQTVSLSLGVRNAHAMAYDSDRKRIVLYGGADAAKVRSDTWEFDGKGWLLASDEGPGPRTFPVMTYDSVRKRVVLFGGNRVLFGRTQQDNEYLNDTWEWDGRKWTEIKVAGPPPRAEAVMAFDRERGRAVLFGGHCMSEKSRNRWGDTWEWDGTKWMQITITGPSPRNGGVCRLRSSEKENSSLRRLDSGRSFRRDMGMGWSTLDTTCRQH